MRSSAPPDRQRQIARGLTRMTASIAAGVIAAVKDLGVRVPIVIRMEGTNVEIGRQMLRESGLNFTTADGMGEAAEAVVKLAVGQ